MSGWVIIRFAAFISQHFNCNLRWALPPSQPGSAEIVQKWSDQPDISQTYTSIHIEGMFGMQTILNQAGAQTDLAP